PRHDAKTPAIEEMNDDRDGHRAPGNGGNGQGGFKNHGKECKSRERQVKGLLEPSLLSSYQLPAVRVKRAEALDQKNPTLWVFLGDWDCMADDNIGPVAQLFAQEVPEIAAGTIRIKAIARKPGYRCKLALQSQDPRVDCIGVCVGVRGVRIKKV